MKLILLNIEMIRLFIFFISLTYGQVFGQNVEPLLLSKDIPWNTESLNQAPKFEWVRQEGKVHALMYVGEKYRGIFHQRTSEHELCPLASPTRI